MPTNALPLLAKICLRQDETTALEGLLLPLRKFRLLTLSYPGSISIANGLYDQFEWNSFLRTEGETLINQYVHRNAGVQTDRKGNSIKILAFMVKIFSNYFCQVLTQLVVTLPFLMSLQTLRQRE